MAIGRAGKAAAAAYVVRSGTALIALGAVLLRADRAAAQPQEPLVQPSEIRSENGVLEATITAAPGRVQLGEFAFPGRLYNGAYMPPLLRARLGDTMRITFRNSLPDDPSNLHYHGMSVSPQGNSDNVFVHVHPGQRFEYEVRIPAAGRQGPGFFWYHPHAHGVVAKQILGGMSGALVVDGSDRLFPMLRDLPERFFLIKHAEIGEGTEIISINGQINPIVQIRPGEMQFWRIGHIGATLFIKFSIEGMPLYVVATDGHPLSPPRKVTEFFLGPGEADRRDRDWSGRRRIRHEDDSISEPSLAETGTRASSWRRSCQPARGHRPRKPRPRFCISASAARDGSMKSGPPRLLAGAR